MVYHPYFRGKQFELVAIRETAALMAESAFVPIIEPVKEQFKILRKTLDTIRDEEGSVVVITNPQIGEHQGNSAALVDLLVTEYGQHHNIVPGLLMTADMSPNDAVQFAEYFEHRDIAIVHGSMSDGKSLAGAIENVQNIASHIFLDKKKLYQNHFAAAPSKILVRDGFEWRPANRDYPDVEEFSDLHITYQMEGMTGFGDFLMVGHRFTEGGGPAYAIAIHLTYIDPEQDNGMFIRHFKSDSQNTPTNPAGKFAEAVAKLVAEVDEPGSKIRDTTAVQEFRDFHNAGHYPGLGYVKKLSMIHHIETLAAYLDGA